MNKPNNKVEETCSCKNCHPGLCKCKCHSFNQSKYDVDLEERVRHEFSTIIPKAVLLKGKEILCGTVRFKHLLSFIEKERTSSYEQGREDERERIINIIKNSKPSPMALLKCDTFPEAYNRGTHDYEKHILQTLKNN